MISGGTVPGGIDRTAVWAIAVVCAIAFGMSAPGGGFPSWSAEDGGARRDRRWMGRTGQRGGPVVDEREVGEQGGDLRRGPPGGRRGRHAMRLDDHDRVVGGEALQCRTPRADVLD